MIVACLVFLGCSDEKPATRPISATKPTSNKHFHIGLVGIGPGEPDLITVRAKRFLQEADRVICFDWLSNEVAKHLGGPEKIKAVTFESLGAPDSRERATFCAQVRRWMATGEKIVFATAGDPTLCSPFSWVPVEFADWYPVVVPGVGSIPAAAAELAQSIMDERAVMISTGDRFSDTDSKGRLADVIAFFTHLRSIEQLLPELVKRYPGDTPVAIVGDAARPGVEPVIVRATLDTLEKSLSEKKLPKLYLVFVGDPLKQKKVISLPDQSHHHHKH